jgi:hypothetical protein
VTDANRETAIREELSRAESALAASMLLGDGGFPLDAVSRRGWNPRAAEKRFACSRCTSSRRDDWNRRLHTCSPG